MNPIITELLYAILRYVVTAAISWLLARHVITEDQQQAFLGYFTDPTFMALVVGSLVPLAIALRAVIKSRLKLLTALSLPAATTERTVEQMAKTDAPALSTPKNDVPTSPAPKE